MCVCVYKQTVYSISTLRPLSVHLLPFSFCIASPTAVVAVAAVCFCFDFPWCGFMSEYSRWYEQINGQSNVNRCPFRQHNRFVHFSFILFSFSSFKWSDNRTMFVSKERKCSWETWPFYGVLFLNMWKTMCRWRHGSAETNNYWPN